MKKEKQFADYIEHINIEGLKGRMLNMPARSKEAAKLDILFIHGHHSSIERNQGVEELLSAYGNVCAPDMPGFGGMQPLRKIGQKPTIDNLADYLAAFIRLRYGTRKKFVIVGVSFGFVVVTRMLQKYPELQPRCIAVISVVGFLSGDEFIFTKRRMRVYKFGCYMVAQPLTSFMLRELLFRKWFMSTVYKRTKNAKEKFRNATTDEVKYFVEFETHLWRCNDVPTHYDTCREFLGLDLLADSQQIKAKLVHVHFSADQYFDGDVVKEHMKVAYENVRIIDVVSDSHAPSIVASEAEAAQTFPIELRTYLESLR